MITYDDQINIKVVIVLTNITNINIIIDVSIIVIIIIIIITIMVGISRCEQKTSSEEERTPFFFSFRELTALHTQKKRCEPTKRTEAVTALTALGLLHETEERTLFTLNIVYIGHTLPHVRTAVI